MILGDKEIAYIATMSEQSQKRSFDFLTGEETPAIVITRGHECPQILRECALEKNFPVFCCEEKTNHTIVNIITWLDERLAKSVSVHGELLIIYGTGVMICGESGMGKSEIALELIKRGHQLVADDRVDCYRIHNHLVGRSPQLLEGMLELRGVGVINIARMYGVGAVAHKANVDIQITLEEFDPRANYDRVGIEEKKNVSILDVEVPKITISACWNLSKRIRRGQMQLFPDPKILLSIGNIHVTWYAVFILTGALIAYALSLRTLKKWGYDSEMLENFFVPMLLIAIIGARLYYVIFEWERYVADPISAGSTASRPFCMRAWPICSALRSSPSSTASMAAGSAAIWPGHTARGMARCAL